MKCSGCRTDNPAGSVFCGKCGTPLPGTEAESPLTRTINSDYNLPEKGSLFARKYRIAEELGRGGMGVVFKAEDTRLKRPVALKILPPELSRSQEANARFVREAQSAAALDHPNICTVYEIGDEKGRLYIAMACIEGLSLKQRIKQGKLDVDEILDIARQIAEGLAEAHRAGIIHRDIKPANIMLDNKGRARIMDFGLARLEDAADITRSPAVMGTAAYMSPEQAQGLDVDLRTDIWSFGCMLYELAAGRLPFSGKSDQSVLYAVVHAEPAPLFSLRPGVPADLVKIIQKCLHKDPQNRYSDTADLVSDLKSVNLREPVAAENVSVRKEPPSLAVLPFADMSPDKDQDYFGEGIAEELIHALARIQELRVVARTSAFALKGRNMDVRDIGRMLNVQAVLEGSVRKAGRRLRITVQLVNVADGFHLWSERFDREAEDVFTIQDEISMAIVENLKGTLKVGEKSILKKRSTYDSEAHNSYLKGLYYFARPNPESGAKALHFFQEALNRDPDFALAYSGIAHVYSGMGIMNFIPPNDAWPKAKSAFHKALSLDENLAEAKSVAASMALWYEWDWDAAEKALKDVLKAKPGDAYTHGTYSWFLLNRTKFREGVEEIKQAINLDPLMPLYYAWSVALHTAAGLYDEALREFDKAMEVDPTLGLAYFHGGIALARKGLFDRALDSFEKSIKFGVYPGWAEGCMGMVLIHKGDRPAAERVYKEMLEKMEKTHYSYVCVAWQAGILGKFDLAFANFDRAYEEKDLLMPFVHVYTPILVPELTQDPRFEKLMAKMNMTDVWSKLP